MNESIKSYDDNGEPLCALPEDRESNPQREPIEITERDVTEWLRRRIEQNPNVDSLYISARFAHGRCWFSSWGFPTGEGEPKPINSSHSDRVAIDSVVAAINAKQFSA